MLRTWGNSEVSWILHHRSLSNCPQVSHFVLLFTVARALNSGVTTVRVSYCVYWQNFICVLWIITSHCIKYVVGLLLHTASSMSLDYYFTLRRICRWIITSHCVEYVVGLLLHTASNMSLDYYATLHQICRWIITSHCVEYVVGLLRHTASSMPLDYYATLRRIFVGLLRHTT
jgi:hypothetical protein